MKSALYLDIAEETGYCHGRPGQYEAGIVIFKPDKNYPYNQRFQKIYDWLRRINPKRVVAEKAFTRWANTAQALYGYHAILGLYCIQAGIELITVPNKEWKKAVVGNGNASKEKTQAFLHKKHGIVEFNDNIADAICLMLYDNLSGAVLK